MKITEPTLLLDKKKCLKNIEMMAEKAKRNDVRFRPHFKTHQSITIGKWFKDFGVKAITVSSLSMASAFAGEFKDITVAFPVNLLKMKEINNLNDSITLNLLVEDKDTIEQLALGLRNRTNVFIKIDVGYNRTGIQAEDTEEVDALLAEIDKHSSKLRFKGLLTHAGHSYESKSTDEICAIHDISIRKMVYLKSKYLECYPEMEISVGDTPTCSVVDDFKLVDEIRPGNFVFYDLMQMELGSCTFDQVAVVLACPVVAVHRDRLIIHGGAIHLSKEFIRDQTEGLIYGAVVQLQENGWSEPFPGMKVVSLSQEHGVVAHPGHFKVGDVIGIIPVHSCLTANLMRYYTTLDGNRIDLV
jgi:D-serine deaminase-like pyridoxal phosphate-dependent protein